MKMQLRAIGFGLLTAMVLVSVVEAFGHMVYPLNDKIDYNNREEMRLFIASMPFGALVFLVNAWIIGAFGGGIVASRMHTEKGQFNALVVGLLVLAFTVLNMSMLPHPTWMWLTAFLTIVPGAWLGFKVASKKE